MKKENSYLFTSAFYRDSSPLNLLSNSTQRRPSHGGNEAEIFIIGILWGNFEF